ncbi:MAG TPA: hypothetical protein VFB89_07825 [Gemmatimonadales bacterium]|nr:hypothetical protein [Gemmatimonadales bacterium]
MAHSLRPHGALASFALLLALAGCSSSGGSDWVTPAPAAGKTGTGIYVTGVVHHVDVEGGFYVIRGEDGVTYDPTNLPQEFQKDGLSVEADVRKRDDAVGTHMTGTIVDLVRIRKR